MINNLDFDPLKVLPYHNLRDFQLQMEFESCREKKIKNIIFSNYLNYLVDALSSNNYFK